MSAETDEYPSLRFQDIRKNQSVADGHTDERTNGCENTPPQSLQGGGGGGGGWYKYVFRPYMNRETERYYHFEHTLDVSTIT